MFRFSCATRGRKHLPSTLSARVVLPPGADCARRPYSSRLSPCGECICKKPAPAGVTGSKSRELNGLGGEKFSNRPLRRGRRTNQPTNLLIYLPACLPCVALERRNSSSGLHSSLHWSVGRCSNRAVVRSSSRLPVAVGRPAEGGVASLRPWQIAIYEQ